MELIEILSVAPVLPKEIEILPIPIQAIKIKP